MAILHGGPNGGFSGKAGSIVGYQQYGKWVIRGLPKYSKKNKKGSLNQNICRSKFSKMQNILNPLLPFIRVGFNLEAKRNGNSAHNSAKSWNMLNAFNDEGEINYAAFRFSMGDLRGAVDAAVELNEEQLVFRWRDNSKDAGNRAEWDFREDDQVMILVYDNESNSLYGTMSGARRSEERQIISISKNKKPVDHPAWISFISDDRQRIANSSFVGLVCF